MKYEEAIKEIEWIKERGFVADRGIVGTDRIIDACDLAIKALKIADCKDQIISETNRFINAVNEIIGLEKYRWHDLRNNPEDLPGDFRKVLICIKGLEGKESGINTAVHSKKTKTWGATMFTLEESDVIAWRYIEPFEEVSE